jgi:hypothetical protein
MAMLLEKAVDDTRSACEAREPRNDAMRIRAAQARWYEYKSTHYLPASLAISIGTLTVAHTVTLGHGQGSDIVITLL